MPELAHTAAAASISYNLLLSGLLAAPKQDASPLLSLDGAPGLGYGLAPGLTSPDQRSLSYGSVSEASIASTPSAFAAASPSSREASSPPECLPVPNLAQLFMAMPGGAQAPMPDQSMGTVMPSLTTTSAASDDQLMMLMRSLSGTSAPALSPSAPPPAPQACPSPPSAKLSHGLDYDSACQSLKAMTASGTPATAILQFLKLSRAALGRDIPAEVVLEGLLEREKHKPAQQRPATEQRNPSPLTSLGVSSIGPERGSRVSLRAAASPYAIPSGPRVYQCDQCPLVFDRAYNLKEHLKTHDPNCSKRFPCPISDCPHASHRRADMHRHIKNVHARKEGLTEAQKSTVLKLYPAMRPDLSPDQDQDILPAASPSPSHADDECIDWKALVRTD